MGKLDHKSAIVTGASKGIGAAIAKALAKEGAKVVVNYASSQKGADRVVDEIVREGGQAIAVQADLTKPADIKKLFEEASKAFGPLDILINNAGVYDFAPLSDITEAHFFKIFNLNVLAVLLAIQEAVKYFDPEKGGSIVNVSSLTSSNGTVNGSVYAASKAALDAITRSLAKELAPKKIRVNSINPGLIETEGVHSQGITDKDLHAAAQSTPLGRVGQPEDIAPAALFLASNDAGWITGETLYATGGKR